jgi:hypothetical protein
MVRKFLLLISAFLIFYNCQYAQQDSLFYDISSEIKELDNLHEIIYPIWHNAYPVKDYAALRSYLPEVNKLSDNLFSANLPGILRDKQKKWDDGITELKKAVADYNESVKSSDEEALLKAAENLHSKYEMMVRIIRPVLKEVDEFHKVLYIVYHKDLPEKNYAAIKSASKEFVIKAEAITKAKLSKRFENKTYEFKVAASDLLTAAQEFEKTCSNESNQNINVAVNKLHSKYQVLEKIFD